jgi:hypothetical protein
MALEDRETKGFSNQKGWVPVSNLAWLRGRAYEAANAQETSGRRNSGASPSAASLELQRRYKHHSALG